MGVVYRYIDLSDNEIKYVGIVWSGKRTLKQRDEEHQKNDEWCQNSDWRVEYLSKEITSRTDAEMLEAHYIAKFGTDKWFNKAKSNWGESEYVSGDEEWLLYRTDEEQVSEMEEEQEVEWEIRDDRGGGELGLSLEVHIGKNIYGFFLASFVNIYSISTKKEWFFSVNSSDLIKCLFNFSIWSNENIYDLIDELPTTLMVKRSEITGEIEEIVSDEFNITLIPRQGFLDFVVDDHILLDLSRQDKVFDYVDYEFVSKKITECKSEGTSQCEDKLL